jgi:BTB And C-terminal Kelch
VTGVDARELRFLIKYSYLGKCDFLDLDSDDLVQLLRATVRLEVSDLTSQIEAYFEQNLSVSTALQLYSLEEYINIFFLMQKNLTLIFLDSEMGLEYSFRIAKEFLLRHFLTEVDLQNQDVDLKILMSLLKNDMLHVRYEEQIWEAIEDWVKKDQGARKVHFDQLVKCLRVGLVSESFLQKKASEIVGPINLIFYFLKYDVFHLKKAK